MEKPISKKYVVVVIAIVVVVVVVTHRIILGQQKVVNIMHQVKNLTFYSLSKKFSLFLFEHIEEKKMLFLAATCVIDTAKHASIGSTGFHDWLLSGHHCSSMNDVIKETC